MLLEEALETTPPNADEVKAAWARDPSRFLSPPLWEISHILVACDPADKNGASQAREKAEMILESVSKKPDDFRSIAKTMSDCPSRNKDGFIGQVGPDDLLPEFAFAIRDLKEEEICSEIVVTKFGYHVVRMDGIAERRVLPFEVVEAKLAEAMEKTAWTKAAANFVGTLMSQADISGNDKLL